VREDGRTVLVLALIATGVNAEGKQEILGLEPPPIPSAPAVPPMHVMETPVHTSPAVAHSADVGAPVAAPAPAAFVTPVQPSAAPVETGSAAPEASVPPPTVAPGPLPPYGSDLRLSSPAASSVPASTTSSSAALVASPPPAQPAGPVASPAVVRQTTVSAPQSPAAVGAQAVVATATGAAAGAASGAAARQAGLQRLVDFVARQKPRLRWAVAERADGTTILATDLASGWIPPGVELPASVQLLPPAKRHGDLTAMLGETEAVAAFTPGYYVSPAEDAEPVNVSSRPRRADPVDELGWELGQARLWRDGLPRLAHTLAKAASSGTGVLDSETDDLQAHFNTLQADVLNSYPDSVDQAALSNYMLLAAIDALVHGDRTAANYHFAWSKAISAPADIPAGV